MKHRRMIAAVLTAVMLLTGCSSLSLNRRDILSPPQAAGERAAIRDLIKADAGGSYNLLYPLSGDYRNCIISRDLDADGTEEVVVFYTKVDGSPCLLIAADSDSGLQTVASADLRSTQISRVGFADVNGDERYELLVVCDAGTAASSLTVYGSGGIAESVGVAEGFTDYAAGDLDGDADDDILLFFPASVEHTSTAELMVYADGKWVRRSSCETDPNVISYTALSYGKVDSGVYGITADGTTQNGDYTTQLLYYDASAKALVNPLLIYSGYERTMRSPAIISHDINGNGIVEIPLCSLMEYAKNEAPAYVCKLADWCDFNRADLTLEPRQRTMLCEDMGFMLVLKPEFSNIVTARYTDVDTVTLYRMSYKDSEPVLGDVMLTIRRFDKSGFDGGADNGSVLYDNEACVYTYSLGDTDGEGYTDDEVKSSFKLIDNP